MVVISKTVLNEFGIKHPDAIEALNDWWEKVKKSNWATPNDLKKTFGTVDYGMCSTSKETNIALSQ